MQLFSLGNLVVKLILNILETEVIKGLQIVLFYLIGTQSSTNSLFGQTQLR